jgi:hypothetical protein
MPCGIISGTNVLLERAQNKEREREQEERIFEVIMTPNYHI